MVHPMGQWTSKGYGQDGSRISCTSTECYVMTTAYYGETQDADAITAWNTRAYEPDQAKIAELQAEVERLKSTIAELEKR